MPRIDLTQCQAIALAYMKDDLESTNALVKPRYARLRELEAESKRIVEEVNGIWELAQSRGMRTVQAISEAHDVDFPADQVSWDLRTVDGQAYLEWDAPEAEVTEATEATTEAA